MSDGKRDTRGKRTLSKAQRKGTDQPTRNGGRLTDEALREELRKLSRSFAVPPRREINKERTNATERAERHGDVRLH